MRGGRTVSGQRPLQTDISAREAEVLAALGEHLTNAEIATRFFISVRTVESHVSSLLRKLQVPDRRALAVIAASAGVATSGIGDREQVSVRLPPLLTQFVGRAAERAALAETVAAHRLVTVVGPGGVGKTRLACTVVADLAARFADGACFVDLVPVTQGSMIAPAIAAALGLGEEHGRSPDRTVLDWLSGRQFLLVLDNCEHVLDGVATLAERLLAGSPGLTVLLTSRARLRVPFEWVFSLTGLSIEAADGGPGDAVALFRQRAEAAGVVLTEHDTERVAAICRRLEGLALAIELAAARVHALGLDGVEAGLPDRMRLLTGGSRAGRHRSLQATLDWSYALLDDLGQMVLRRICVFAAPFTPEAVLAVLAGWPGAPAGAIRAALADLVDHSLLTMVAGGPGTSYRIPETIRQYGSDRLAETAESAEAHSRHVRWCLDAAAALEPSAAGGTARAAFDGIADELRGALAWAAGAHRHAAYQLAIRLAELTFGRGLISESQARYEHAAELAADDHAAASALSCAAGAAEARFSGEAVRLRRAAADAAIRTGNRPAAAAELARAAEIVSRSPGLFASEPDLAEGLLAQARPLGGGDAAAEARILAADAFRRARTDPAAPELAERAVALAQRAANPLAESAALDQLIGSLLCSGDTRAAAAAAFRRIELADQRPATAAAGYESCDALVVAEECAVALGELDEARRFAGRIGELPFHTESSHLAAVRMIPVTALTGDWDETMVLASRVRDEWELAGRPRSASWAKVTVGCLARGAYAAATVSGLRGDEGARTAYLELLGAVAVPGRDWRGRRYGQFLDAWLLLHQGRVAEALCVLDQPARSSAWHNGLWRPWHAALQAEAAVLGGVSDAAARVTAARELTRDNPIAAAIVDRAAALAGDPAGLEPAAAALQSAGCRYQWARTLVLIGGADRERGESLLAGMGATAMVCAA